MQECGGARGRRAPREGGSEDPLACAGLAASLGLSDRDLPPSHTSDPELRWGQERNRRNFENQPDGHLPGDAAARIPSDHQGSTWPASELWLRSGTSADIPSRPQTHKVPSPLWPSLYTCPRGPCWRMGEAARMWGSSHREPGVLGCVYKGVGGGLPALTSDTEGRALLLPARDRRWGRLQERPRAPDGGCDLEGWAVMRTGAVTG